MAVLFAIIQEQQVTQTNPLAGDATGDSSRSGTGTTEFLSPTGAKRPRGARQLPNLESLSVRFCLMKSLSLPMIAVNIQLAGQNGFSL